MHLSRSFARAFPIVVLAFAALGAPQVAAQQASFCEALKRVMHDKPNNFETFKTGEWHERTKEWDASVQLPTLRTCRVDVELKNYNCFTA
jgi:hypothetical protein